MASKYVKVICNDCHRDFEKVDEAAYHHCKAKKKTLKGEERSKEEREHIEKTTFDM